MCGIDETRGVCMYIGSLSFDRVRVSNKRRVWSTRKLTIRGFFLSFPFFPLPRNPVCFEKKKGARSRRHPRRTGFPVRIHPYVVQMKSPLHDGIYLHTYIHNCVSRCVLRGSFKLGHAFDICMYLKGSPYFRG